MAINYYSFNKLSHKTFCELTLYYKNLYSTQQEKTPAEIRKELEMCDETLRKYWEKIGLYEGQDVDSLNDMAKIVLLQTKFVKYSKYYAIRQELLEKREKLKRRKQIYQLIKEGIEIKNLKDSRKQLVRTLQKVYEKRK